MLQVHQFISFTYVHEPAIILELLSQVYSTFHDDDKIIQVELLTNSILLVKSIFLNLGINTVDHVLV